MKRVFNLVLFIVLFFYACEKDSPTESNTDQRFVRIQNLMDSSFNSYMTLKNIPDSSSILLYVNYKGSTKFLGTNNKNSYNEKSKFRIASNTKTFTAAAIMLLHQQGKLNINDKISDTIPGTKQTYLPLSVEYNIPFRDNITIKLLLQHRAGVWDLGNSNIPDTVKKWYSGKNYIEYALEQYGSSHQFTFPELIKVVAESHIYYFEPGADYHYSNTGYSILGYIIERVSGLSYSDFIEQNLYLPNNMTNTSSPDDALQTHLPEPYVEGYLYNSNIIKNVTEDNMSAFVAEGNMISTFENLSTWIKALMLGEAGLNTQTVNLMKDYTDNPTAMYGCGLAFKQHLGYGHTGAHSGYISFMFYDPDKDLTIIMLSNLWDLSNDFTTFNEQYAALVNLILNINKEF